MSFRNGFITNHQEFQVSSHDTESKKFAYHQKNNQYQADNCVLFRKNLKAELSQKLKQKEKLFNQYDTYLSKYLDDYKKWFLKEYKQLKQQFPEVNFEWKIRIKSRDSYEKKVMKKLSQGTTDTIYDIFGSKIIIYGIQDSSTIPITMIRDENALIRKCFEIYNYLLQKENFRVKETRNYIQNPKASNYRSLHILGELHPFSHSFLSEIQIKTFQMHEKEEFGDSGHRAYKNRNLLLAQNCRPIEECVPLFFQVYENSAKGKLSIYQKPFSDCFKEFFDISLTDYLNEKANEIKGIRQVNRTFEITAKNQKHR